MRLHLYIMCSFSLQSQIEGGYLDFLFSSLLKQFRNARAVYWLCCCTCDTDLPSEYIDSRKAIDFRTIAELLNNSFIIVITYYSGIIKLTVDEYPVFLAIFKK